MLINRDHVNDLFYSVPYITRGSRNTLTRCKKFISSTGSSSCWNHPTEVKILTTRPECALFGDIHFNDDLWVLMVCSTPTDVGYNAAGRLDGREKNNSLGCRKKKEQKTFQFTFFHQTGSHPPLIRRPRPQCRGSFWMENACENCLLFAANCPHCTFLQSLTKFSIYGTTTRKNQISFDHSPSRKVSIQLHDLHYGCESISYTEQMDSQPRQLHVQRFYVQQSQLNSAVQLLVPFNKTPSHKLSPKGSKSLICCTSVFLARSHLNP